MWWANAEASGGLHLQPRPFSLVANVESAPYKIGAIAAQMLLCFWELGQVQYVLSVGNCQRMGYQLEDSKNLGMKPLKRSQQFGLVDDSLIV